MYRVLYVEDNFQNYRLVMRMLMMETEQYEITQAATGSDGLRLAAEIKPDLILMDINLPDMDGIEVTRRLKADPLMKHTPVVALTANAMMGDQERILKAGCDGYLKKPLSRADLHGALAAHLLNRNGGGKKAAAHG